MRWFVVCAEYRCGPFRTRAEAERRMTQVAKAGTCPHNHILEARTQDTGQLSNEHRIEGG